MQLTSWRPVKRSISMSMITLARMLTRKFKMKEMDLVVSWRKNEDDGQPGLLEVVNGD